MQAPGGPKEDPSGGFKYGGWSFHYWDDVMNESMAEASKVPYDLLLGRKTYDIFAAHWPFLKDDPMADKFNKATKYVATRTLKSGSWQNTVLLKDDFIKEVKKIKSSDGIELQVHGSGNMIQTLLKNNLIDEMRVWIFPLAIGNGKKLFAEGTVPSNLKLTNPVISKTGVIIATYVPDGEIRTGSFALEDQP